MSDTPWPPEGTRVRIVGTLEDGSIGVLDQDGRSIPFAVENDFRWVRLDAKGYWPVERHEIEVISEHDSSHKKTMD